METAEARLKRMKIRSWRRGIKEMDLMLGPFADSELEKLDEEQLSLFDRLLGEYDPDLLAWVIGTETPPDWIQPILAKVIAFSETRHGFTR